VAPNQAFQATLVSAPEETDMRRSIFVWSMTMLIAGIAAGGEKGAPPDPVQAPKRSSRFLDLMPYVAMQRIPTNVTTFTVSTVDARHFVFTRTATNKWQASRQDVSERLSYEVGPDALKFCDNWIQFPQSWGLDSVTDWRDLKTLRNGKTEIAIKSGPKCLSFIPQEEVVQIGW
jgi:hypothetical protein